VVVIRNALVVTPSIEMESRRWFAKVVYQECHWDPKIKVSSNSKYKSNSARFFIFFYLNLLFLSSACRICFPGINIIQYRLVSLKV
jgi:hypothetical protein